MKKIFSWIFVIIALILSHTMAAVIAYEYRNMICLIEHNGASAPAYIAFINAVPYSIGIIFCLVTAAVLHKKSH